MYALPFRDCPCTLGRNTEVHTQYPKLSQDFMKYSHTAVTSTDALICMRKASAQLSYPSGLSTWHGVNDCDIGGSCKAKLLHINRYSGHS